MRVTLLGTTAGTMHAARWQADVSGRLVTPARPSSERFSIVDRLAGIPELAAWPLAELPESPPKASLPKLAARNRMHHALHPAGRRPRPLYQFSSGPTAFYLSPWGQFSLYQITIPIFSGHQTTIPISLGLLLLVACCCCYAIILILLGPDTIIPIFLGPQTTIPIFLGPQTSIPIFIGPPNHYTNFPRPPNHDTTFLRAPNHYTDVPWTAAVGC